MREKDWKGISFLGGHIEVGGAIVPSVEREVLEETGFMISNVDPCGIKDIKKKRRGISFSFIRHLLLQANYFQEQKKEKIDGLL